MSKIKSLYDSYINDSIKLWFFKLSSHGDRWDESVTPWRASVVTVNTEKYAGCLFSGCDACRWQPPGITSVGMLVTPSTAMKRNF